MNSGTLNLFLRVLIDLRSIKMDQLKFRRLKTFVRSLYLYLKGMNGLMLILMMITKY